MANPINALTPVKGLRDGKSRLSDVLEIEDRISLNTFLTSRTIQILKSAFSEGEVVVISPDADVQLLAMKLGAKFVQQENDGLNAGLTKLAAQLPSVRTVVVAADLPNMTVEDLLSMRVDSGIAIAPDESGLGTNALSLPSPTAISFQYGYGSFNAHCKEARTKKYPLKTICRPGLAFDLDTKDDLTRLKGWP